MTPITLLVDNGSLVAASTLRLREIASGLEAEIADSVMPVSLLHSSAIPRSELGNIPARIFEPTVAHLAREGATEFIVVPLFFGPSRALSHYLPERVDFLKSRHPQLRVRVAPALFQEDDDRLARILADHVAATAGRANGLRVALVDHGSPVAEVTAVRDALAAQMTLYLGFGTVVSPSSMERRPGAEYDFNEPLLEKLLGRDGWNAGEVIVALQFLLPGRHAGPEGDVAAICARATERSPRLRTRLTPLVGEHPLLLSILADRWRIARHLPAV